MSLTCPGLLAMNKGQVMQNSKNIDEAACLMCYWKKEGEAENQT